MSSPGPRASRPAIVISALIYLMSSYRRAPCPRLAQCIAGHLECLSRHPDADPVIREICAGMVDKWRGACPHVVPPAAKQRSFLGFKLH